ncbi:hypothetical protein [Streptomyces sp. Z26]|nr:hypothetical protein [Streptomyces sp. Z26]
MSDFRKTRPAKPIDVIKVPGGIGVIRPGRPAPTRPSHGPTRPTRPIGGC